jgi:hypothetical protein
MVTKVFVGRLEQEMFEQFAAVMQHRIANTDWKNEAELRKLIDDINKEHMKYFDYCFQPEFKDMSLKEFLAIISKRH